MNIPPLAQLALCIVIAGLLAAFIPIALFEASPWLVVATALAGVLFLLPAVLSFIRHKTTVNPQSPDMATTLVTNGIYSVTRNPMYVGMLIVLMAFVLWLGAVSAVSAVLAFYLMIDRGQIRGEEAALTQTFGKHFEDYAARVPRWLFISITRGTTHD
ncbi:methyltransferase family protein [Sulfitobacter donghicola]|uniref:Protein-S-isoprenylcysteine methyltransferase n=1 Tax=Sulfitobacter donghicola DSW-25 = KCTC 12864 = JCM 14565 TaxID=1300350 RepID=A0A073IHP6_9RHOB|nr:isoprenylcysteine carboxylmethyltransferase family protein [Sulfitobacter donghicola]KEJ89006.1 protein-S-isoprenylcysteine methyltransferase [Sulfitobacter donghicola DSW-25 = KCTC 12864 = JCM 14565]KIN67437.1 Isoprenylcysteine carboxyl methyltransferase [Sulfitobacter donghicola DSW-25 = KCTC 12864 = JCM 14565]